MLNLNFKCAGSPSPGFFECINLYDDIHNVTDNETCRGSPSKTDQCDVSFQHYYGDQEKHTVVVIIWNDVSRQVARTVVNIYKVTSHSPLSVIIVPISCVLMAVIFVIFGIAYYIQNRNRYLVEVADFNFGDTQSIDMEYKTFRQRLLESMADTFSNLRPSRRHDIDDSVHDDPDSSLRYGSMT